MRRRRRRRRRWRKRRSRKRGRKRGRRRSRRSRRRLSPGPGGVCDDFGKNTQKSESSYIYHIKPLRSFDFFCFLLLTFNFCVFLVPWGEARSLTHILKKSVP